MDIPKKLDDLIKQDKNLTSAVYGVIDKYVQILGNQNTGLFFFPEYTDHGPDHIKGVLETATALITDKVWEKNLLTPEDASVLVIAALLHDSAMMLTPDAFKRILEPSWKKHSFDEKKWSLLFEDYLTEAKRWDYKKINRVLGDERMPNGNVDISDIIQRIMNSFETKDWTPSESKFLGEFIRRHHARLSHEIAEFGFPKHGKPCKSDILLPEALLDISGFVARSHNMPLRSTFDYLKDVRGGNVSCYKTHPIYLMVLLRIADYLQIDSSRVSEGFRSIQRLRSPISNDEWDAHLAVEYIDQHQDDIESILVFAKPENAKIFLKLKNLLSGLQSELDSSWAIMGELYSKDSTLRDLGITLRRVRSNLDDVQEYIRTQKPSYYPMHAVFDTEGASLLKLLIKPLYGDRPEIGVRELLQNSLDAVRELRKYCEMHKRGINTLSFPEQDADVLIAIDEHEDGNHYLTITDKGIGMTAETVRDYFLKAGASFRNSDYWQKEFVQDGKSTVLRSGRFGIGALAAFLLGDRMEVRTRHISVKPEDGVFFKAGLTDEHIQLSRKFIRNYGTVIKIQLTGKILHEINIPFKYSNIKKLSWYVLNDPFITIKVKNRILKQDFHFPSNLTSDRNRDWKRIQHNDYDEIIWSYQFLKKIKGQKILFKNADMSDYNLKNNYEDVFYSNIICHNGIFVNRSEQESNGILGWNNSEDNSIKLPVISVIDTQSKLPLNLLRDSLETKWLPFHDELLLDVTKDFCSFLLASLPIKTDKNPFNIKYPLYHDKFSWMNKPFEMYALKEGYVFSHIWHMMNIQIKRVVISTKNVQYQAQIGEDTYPSTDFGVHSEKSIAIIEGYFRDHCLNHDFFYPWNGVVGIRMYTSNRKRGLYLFNKKKDKILIKNTRKMANGNIISYGEMKYDDSFIIKEFNKIQHKNSDEIIAVLEFHIDTSKIKHNPSPFTNVWEDIMEGNAIIPYSMEERRKKFAKAFVVLKDYIKAWEHPVTGGWREKCLPKR